jgi:hypothetical protein
MKPARSFDGALPDLFGGLLLSLMAMGLLTWGYYSQGYGTEVASSEPALPSLMFFTIGAAFVVGSLGFFFFVQSRRNRYAAERALSGNADR